MRVTFSRRGWRISNSADISAYLEFVTRPQRYITPRPSSTADHLAKYRFRSTAEIARLLPTLAEDFRQPEARNLESWLRHPRYIGQARRLLPEARQALRELAGGLLATSRDLAGVIITSPYLTETPTRLIGVIGIYSWLPVNQKLAAVASQLASEQSETLGLPVRYLPTDITRLDTTLNNPANETLRDWLTTSRVEYGYATLPV